MRTRLLLVLALLVLDLLTLPSAWAQKGVPYTPKPGSAERKAVVDALRVPVAKSVQKPASAVIFKIDHLKAQNGWAFLRGVPLQKNGAPMNYRGTRYEQAQKDGVFDNGVCALLRRHNKGWRVVAWVLGATDVPYEDWDRRYKAPSAIFR